MVRKVASSEATFFLGLEHYYLLTRYLLNLTPINLIAQMRADGIYAKRHTKTKPKGR